MGRFPDVLEIRAVEITTSNVGHSPMLPELLNQIPTDQTIGSGELANADGAYDTRKCHDAIAARNAHAFGYSLEPMAFASSLPPRKNAKPWKSTTAGAIARNEAAGASRYLGKAIWRRWSGYHRRSRVEAKMSCIKSLGQSLMAKDFDRQVAEIQVRVAVLNRYTALGIPVTEAVAFDHSLEPLAFMISFRPGKGEARHSPDLCNKAAARYKVSEFVELDRITYEHAMYIFWSY